MRLFHARSSATEKTPDPIVFHPLELCLVGLALLPEISLGDEKDEKGQAIIGHLGFTSDYCLPLFSLRRVSRTTRKQLYTGKTMGSGVFSVADELA